MNIFILLALVLGASSRTGNCPTTKEICSGHALCTANCPCPFCRPRRQPRGEDDEDSVADEALDEEMVMESLLKLLENEGEDELAEKLLSRGKTNDKDDYLTVNNTMKTKIYVKAACNKRLLTSRTDSWNTKFEGFGVSIGGGSSHAKTFENVMQKEGFNWISPGQKTVIYEKCKAPQIYLSIKFSYVDKITKKVHVVNFKTGQAVQNGKILVIGGTAEWPTENTKERPCAGANNGCNGNLQLGDGDCDSKYDCAAGLVCGTNNCRIEFGHSGGLWQRGDDCCTTKAGRKKYAYLNRRRFR